MNREEEPGALGAVHRRHATYPKRPYYDGQVQYADGEPTSNRPIPAAQEALSQVIAELAEVQDLVLRRLTPVRNRQDGLAVAANPEPEPARSELHYLLTTQRRQPQDQLIAWRELLEDLEMALMRARGISTFMVVEDK